MRLPGAAAETDPGLAAPNNGLMSMAGGAMHYGRNALALAGAIVGFGGPATAIAQEANPSATPPAPYAESPHPYVDNLDAHICQDMIEHYPGLIASQRVSGYHVGSRDAKVTVKLNDLELWNSTYEFAYDCDEALNIYAVYGVVQQKNGPHNKGQAAVVHRGKTFRARGDDNFKFDGKEKQTTTATFRLKLPRPLTKNDLKHHTFGVQGVEHGDPKWDRPHNEPDIPPLDYPAGSIKPMQTDPQPILWLK